MYLEMCWYKSKYTCKTELFKVNPLFIKMQKTNDIQPLLIRQETVNKEQTTKPKPSQ